MNKGGVDVATPLNANQVIFFSFFSFFFDEKY